MLIFLGAGASKIFGIPDTKGFIELFEKEVGESTLFGDIKRSFGDDLDLEILMTVLEDLTKDRVSFFRVVSPQTTDFLFRMSRDSALKLIENPVQKKEAKEVLDKLKGIIIATCLDAVRKNLGHVVKVYGSLFKTIKNAVHSPYISTSGDGLQLPFPLSIITTNYDTCIEAYLHHHQIETNDGITRRYGADLYDVTSYPTEIPKPKISLRTPAEILKLHGSIDLFIKKGIIRQYTSFSLEKGITSFGEDYGEPVLRWPLEFSGYKSLAEVPYLDLFRLFRNRAQNQSRWLFIGSSFRDISICSLLNDVIRLKDMKDRPKIVFVNPSPEPVIERLRNWGFVHLADLLVSVKTPFGEENCPMEIANVFSRKGI